MSAQGSGPHCPSVHADPAGQATSAHGSPSHPPSRHRWPSGHSTPPHGSATQAPSRQDSPRAQATSAQEPMHRPDRQNSLIPQSISAQGSASQSPSTHNSPSGQPRWVQSSGPQRPATQTWRPGHCTPVQGSSHAPEAAEQICPAGQGVSSHGKRQMPSTQTSKPPHSLLAQASAQRPPTQRPVRTGSRFRKVPARRDWSIHNPLWRAGFPLGFATTPEARSGRRAIRSYYRPKNPYSRRRGGRIPAALHRLWRRPCGGWPR